MNKNLITDTRTPRGQNNWQPWEDEIIKQCSGKLQKEKIANILIFLGSKRKASSVARRAAATGWSIRVKS